jgi:hypothetical protein
MISGKHHSGLLHKPDAAGENGTRALCIVGRARLWVIAFLSLSSVTGTPYATPFTPATPATLQVGPERALKNPSDAARLVRPGDTIEIDAGVYLNDYATWQQENLTIRGVGGLAHLKSTGLIPNGKAIWIVNSNNTTIENIAFSGARVADTNGAGIRHEGGNLTLRNTFFHHNEFSILTGADPQASLEIVDSRFWHQKRHRTFSHGLYIGALQRFSIVGSHITGTDSGHQIKSRALENHILYNRIEDTPHGNSSRLVDLPNCGLSYIVGNDMQQAESTENIDAIGYGAEGCEGRSDRQRRLFVVHNTFINEAWNGTLVKNHAAGDVYVANNLLYGPGRFIMGQGTDVNNLSLTLQQRNRDSWVPLITSGAVDAAQEMPLAEGISLVPQKEFSPPVGTVARIRSDAADVGSRELHRVTATAATATP